MRPLVHLPIIIAAFGAVLSTAACWGQAPTRNGAASGASAPSEVRSLRDFGALGDGRSDDTRALQRAFANSDRYCLDGEGRTYRVNGTLRVDKDLCLRNVTLVQSLVPLDTRPYIRSSCPITRNPAAVVDCGDPVIPADVLPRLHESLSVRTLLIRSDRPNETIRVTLDHVKVDRGRYPEEGSRADSAGIWLQGADPAVLNNVEITGDGKGYGIFVTHSRNVTADNLWVHDIVWAPYAGDRLLSQSEVAAIGWNSVPIHEFRGENQNGGKAAKFYGVRVQEQVTCALFADVQHVVIRKPRITRCMAQFADGQLPWQADGLDIGRSSHDVNVSGGDIVSTWNGMDIVAGGDGVSGLSITNTRLLNSFTFALKFGYDLSSTTVSNVSITNAGIAAIVIYGPVDGIRVSQATINGVGTLAGDGRTFVPFPTQPHSGVLLQEGQTARGPAMATPHNVLIDGVTVVRSQGGPAYDFGIMNKGATDVHVQGLNATGYSRAAVAGGSSAR